MKVRLPLQDGATPVFVDLYPIALKDRVRDELDRLEKEGI